MLPLPKRLRVQSCCCCSLRSGVVTALVIMLAAEALAIMALGAFINSRSDSEDETKVSLADATAPPIVIHHPDGKVEVLHQKLPPAENDGAEKGEEGSIGGIVVYLLIHLVAVVLSALALVGVFKRRPKLLVPFVAWLLVTLLVDFINIILILAGEKNPAYQQENEGKTTAILGALISVGVSMWVAVSVGSYYRQLKEELAEADIAPTGRAHMDGGLQQAPVGVVVMGPPGVVPGGGFVHMSYVAGPEEGGMPVPHQPGAKVRLPDTPPPAYANVAAPGPVVASGEGGGIAEAAGRSADGIGDPAVDVEDERKAEGSSGTVDFEAGVGAGEKSAVMAAPSGNDTV